MSDVVRWHGHYAVLFTNTWGVAPVMHLFRDTIQVDDKWIERVLCGRRMRDPSWLAFRHAVKFGVKCLLCDRIAARKEEGA